LSLDWKQTVEEDDAYGDPSEREWQPVPLEFPIDDPYRRPPAPAGGVEKPDPDEAPSCVIVIDLA
jgi:hypothetical protein